MTATVAARGRSIQASSPAQLKLAHRVLLLGIAMTSFPVTLLAASLDPIRKNLHSSFATISWLQIAPSLAFALGLPISGKIGDLYGARRVYLTALSLATVFSLMTAGAWNVGSLIAIRTAGQLCAGAAGPVAFSIMSAMFTGDDRARAISQYSAVQAMSPMLGIALGGPLIDAFGWRTLFLIQFIPGVIAVTLARTSLPETARGAEVHFDVLGAMLLGTGAGGLMFGINRASVWGIDSPAVVLAMVLGLLLLVGFVLVERHAAEPLLPLHYFRRRAFSATIAGMSLISSSYVGTMVIVPLLLQRRFHYSVTGSSYVIMIRPAVVALGAYLSAPYRRRFGIRTLQMWSVLCMTIGCLCTVASVAPSSLALVMAGLALAGMGNGAAFAAGATSIAEAVDLADVGVAQGVFSMTTSLFGTTSTAVFTSILGGSHRATTFSLVFVLSAALMATAMLPALALPGGRKRRASGPAASAAVGERAVDR